MPSIESAPQPGQLLYQALETEMGGVTIYETAITCWTRELWLDSLGLPAVLPPPEEVRQVETKIGAARAEQSRDQMLRRGH